MKLEDTEKLLPTESLGRRAGYSDTMAALHRAEESSPGYSGSYDAEIKSIYDKIVKRRDFDYDYNADPIYQSYRRDYQRQGKRAMRDTMAQAADLTGGYGSSYAQSVGQQQYGAYLEKLNALMPELYSAAWQRYQAEGDRLSARLTAAQKLADQEYQRHEDEQDRAFQQEKYSYEQRQDAYDNLYEAISSSGYQPSAEELQAAGMSQQIADALRQEYARRIAPKPAYTRSYSSGGGGGGSYSSSASKSKSASGQTSLEKLKLAKNK